MLVHYAINNSAPHTASYLKETVIKGIYKIRGPPPVESDPLTSNFLLLNYQARFHKNAPEQE